MGVSTDHQEICRPLSLSILDQAPLWLSATCVNSFWLVTTDDGSRADSLALAVATCLRFSPIEFEGVPRFLPLLGLMTSRDRGENAVPLSPRGVGIVPTIGLSVVIGTGVPLLSFPRFHGFGQTNRSHPSLSSSAQARNASTSLFPSRSTPSAVKMMVESVWVPCRTVKWISVLRTGCGSGQEVDALARFRIARSRFG